MTRLRDVRASTEVVLYERKGAILWVTLNRPEVRNAMTRQMYAGIVRACDMSRKDGSIKAMVITGAGDEAFCAGADIAQFRNFASVDDAVEYDALGNAAFSALESARITTIAAIRGVCAGGGALLAGSCDLRIASPSARFGVPIARTLGNCLSRRDVGRLTRLLGVPRTLDLLMTARFMETGEMLGCGLVTEVAPDEGSLLELAQLLAERVAGHAPLTIRATKRAIGESPADTADDDRELLASCYMSRDFRGAVEAFLADRRPSWTGT